MHLRRALIGSACLLTTLAACQDTTRPEPLVPALAQHFMDLADAAMQRLELDRGLSLDRAALAIIAGGQVTDVSITEGGVAKSFQAVVLGQDFDGRGAPGFPVSPDQRFLIAWQGTDADRIFTVEVHADSGLVHGPELVADAGAGTFARMTLSESAPDGAVSVARSVDGSATAPIAGLTSACRPFGPRGSGNCQLLRYTVAFTAELKASVADYLPIPDPDAPSRVLTMAAQELTGPRFTPMTSTTDLPPGVNVPRR